MKTYKSKFLGKDYEKLLPDDSLIEIYLDFYGYNRYVPKTFIADLIIIAKCNALRIDIDLFNDYLVSVNSIILENKPKKIVKDIIRLINIFSKKYNLRVVEELANNGNAIDFHNIGKSYNYIFDLNNIKESEIRLLNITNDQLNEIEEIDEAVVEALTMASGIGNFLFKSKSYTLSEKPMYSYGDILKVSKFRFADPLFEYKFSIKSYLVNAENEILVKSDKLIIGYFLYMFDASINVKLLIKLLGLLALRAFEFNSDFSILIYSFYGNSYVKKELNTIEDVIEFFSMDLQLKLFPIDNTNALDVMISENKGEDIIFVPNVTRDCSLRYNSQPGKVTIISSKSSKYNIKYSNICKKTKGMFLTI
jgi:hypothetical protein